MLFSFLFRFTTNTRHVLSVRDKSELMYAYLCMDRQRETWFIDDRLLCNKRSICTAIIYYKILALKTSVLKKWWSGFGMALPIGNPISNKDKGNPHFYLKTPSLGLQLLSSETESSLAVISHCLTSLKIQRTSVRTLRGTTEMFFISGVR